MQWKSPTRWARQRSVAAYLESDAGSELLAEMVKMAAELLMDAEVDVLCNAG